MKSPFTGKEMKVKREWREMTFRKEKFQVLFHHYFCEETGEFFEDEHFTTLNYNQIVNQYRMRHLIPFPDQIYEIRANYKLSASMMSAILGFGANSWRNYEDGEVPSKANANLIQLISKPEHFRDMILKCPELDEKEREKILKNLPKSQENSCDDPFIFFQNKPDVFSGFKAFSREKTKQAVLFFTEIMQPYKTKMNKLLFYLDFVHFRNFAQSITGLKYLAHNWGPVPNKYELLFEGLYDEGVINIESTSIENGEAVKFLPSAKHVFDRSVFTQDEMQTLEYVAKRFKNVSAGKIAEISHNELAWLNNIEDKKLISFEYAFHLETL